MTETPRGSPLADWIRLLRPKQWLKNVLVFAAPGAAGALLTAEVLRQTVAAFAAFTLVSAALYIVNDVVDSERDAIHPRKRDRPIAAGRIAVSHAVLLAAVLGTGGFVLAFQTSPWLGVTVSAYTVLVIGYTFYLKRVAIADILAVALGFVLRAVAGAAATGVPISSWFLIVTSGAALLVIAGKRHAELSSLAYEKASAHRATLERYTLDYLTFVAGVASAVAILAYLLWALDAHPPGVSRVVMTVSGVPFVGALLRYSLIMHVGGGGEPEDVFLTDRPIQLWALAWMVLFVAGLVIG